jgi:rhodanese-related sulfurtransferase
MVMTDLATIGKDELKGLIDRGAVTLVEILPEFRYQESHLPGALNIPPGEVRARAPELLPDKDAEIVVYCGGPT